jgi:hypothetical protein
MERKLRIQFVDQATRLEGDVRTKSEQIRKLEGDIGKIRIAIGEQQMKGILAEEKKS